MSNNNKKKVDGQTSLRSPPADTINHNDFGTSMKTPAISIEMTDKTRNFTSPSIGII